MQQNLDDIQTIESEVNKLHKEAMGIMRHNQSRQQMLQQDTNNLEAKYQRALADIDALKNSYQNKIADNQNIISQIRHMTSMIPEKLVTQYTPQSVLCPANIDIDYLGTLFENINTDTMSSAFKRHFKKDGHYKYEDMVADFLRLAAETELFLFNNITLLKNECSKAVAVKTKYAEDEKKNDLLHHARLEQDLKAEEVRETQALIVKRKTFFETDLIVGFQRRVLSRIIDCGVMQSDWSDYNSKRKHNYNLVLGNIVVPFTTESVSLQKLLIQSIPKYAREGYFELPYLINAATPIKIFWHFDKEDKQGVSEQIQLLLLRMLRSAPVDTFDIYCIDPRERGSNLGILNASFEANQAIGIRVRNSKDEIKAVLKELESYVSETNAKIGSYSSISKYNEKEKNCIKEKVLVIYDYPENFGRDETELLQVIVNNSQKCGIHILFATSEGLAQIKSRFKNDKIDWSFLEDDWVDIYMEEQEIYLPDGDSFEYSAESLKPYHKQFVELYRKRYAKGLETDNLFSQVLPVNSSTSFKDGTNGLKLPVMVRKTKGSEVYELNIGTSTSTHTLITGNTSSGKSTFLHMIISSVIMNYHPDDVELWLIDYGKVELNTYYTYTPPHVRFISLEKSAEFTYSFLDYLKAYFTKREKLFAVCGVADIKDYRKKYGQLSMPRIILIIDEFHNMTQHAHANDEYRIILENALAEYRKFGLSCIFSNQTITGLQGLTDTAKLQIKNRIALSNELKEMKDTLAVSNENYTDEMAHKMERTSVGELWFKEWTSVSDFTINQFKGIYISEQERLDVLHRIIGQNIIVKNDGDIIKINSSERKHIPLNELQNYFATHNVANEYEFIIGSPVTMDKYFKFTIEKRYNQNILIAGREIELKRDIVANLLLNASIQRNYKILAFADPSDALFNALKNAGYLKSKTCNFEVFDNISDICLAINKLVAYMEKKTAQPQPTILLWFGMVDLFDEFGVSPNKAFVQFYNDQGKTKEVTHVSDTKIAEAKNDPLLIELAKSQGLTVEQMLLSVSNNDSDSQRESKDLSYNAKDEVIKIFERGGKLNIFNVLSLDSGFEFRKVTGLKTEMFVHKIVMNLPRDEYFELSVRQSGVVIDDEVSALYTNGTKIQKFRPYLIK